VAAWDTSTAKGDLTPNSESRKLYVQVLDSKTGMASGAPFAIAVTNNRYQEMKAFPDGSVGYAVPGSSNTELEILRVLPCE
jgi:hypothetical protein